MLDNLLGDEVTDPGSYIAEVVYGANDGIVTTFAVVAGVAFLVGDLLRGVA